MRARGSVTRQVTLVTSNSCVKSVRVEWALDHAIFHLEQTTSLGATDLEQVGQPLQDPMFFLIKPKATENKIGDISNINEAMTLTWRLKGSADVLSRINMSSRFTIIWCETQMLLS